TIFSLIASSRGALSTLYPALTKTVTNISPYLKNLSQTTSSKLLALFSSMSAPGFLLADESNHHLIEYLLEALNNLLQFQFSNNPGLVYAILRSHRKFQRLAEFSLDNALIEIERARQAKESRLPRQSSEEPGGATNPGMSEKAKESKNLSYEQIIEYLRNLSITDILPVAHPVIIRKFQWSDPLVIWFRSMLWGQAYIASISNYGPWNNTHVKLFHVKQQQQQQQQQQQSQQVTDDTSFTTRISNA
ncbi:hypothetical protein CU098_000310, partial [Rhizopus stolonifer]